MKSNDIIIHDNHTHLELNSHQNFSFYMRSVVVIQHRPYTVLAKQQLPKNELRMSRFKTL